MAHVVMMPMPASSHMAPMLDLAHKLLQEHQGVAITLVTTPANEPILAPLLAHGGGRVRRLILPPTNLPAENLSALPHHLWPAFMAALEHLSEPLETWLRSPAASAEFGRRPACLVSDFFLGWTHKTAARAGIPRVVFYPSGAFAVSALNALWCQTPALQGLPEEAPVPLRDLPLGAAFRKFQMSRMYRAYVRGDATWEAIREGMVLNTRSWGALVNTFAGLDDESLDHLRRELGGPVWPVGPLLPPEQAALTARGPPTEEHVDVACLEWLDGQPARSVAYVSFGTISVLSEPQVAVLAEALEQSGVRFLWVLGRSHVAEREGEWEWEERVRTTGRGVVVRGWAPQVAVLAHVAVGCFVSHCGWNSVLESVAMGVPLLTWPMGAEQFMNELQVVEHLCVGVSAGAGPTGVPQVRTIVEALKQLLILPMPEAEVEAEASAEARRAAELRKRATSAVGEGGSSVSNVRDFVNAVSALAAAAAKDQDSQAAAANVML